MGVDHNLGGRDNDKSRYKRHKKANRLKKEILRTVTSEPEILKKEVIFNEDARREWLTGFQKRKTKRRQYGVAMQSLKDKKALKDAQVKRRQAHKENLADAVGVTVEELDRANAAQNAVVEADPDAEAVDLYEDEQTRALFGASVAVTVDSTGIAEELDEFRQSRDTAEGSAPQQAQGPNRKQIAFEKAIKVAKKTISDRKFQKKNKAKIDRQREKSGRGGGSKREANVKKEGQKALLSKATGRSMYKGKGLKGKR
jgi:ribosomal RNA-processing protein 17